MYVSVCLCMHQSFESIWRLSLYMSLEQNIPPRQDLYSENTSWHHSMDEGILTTFKYLMKKYGQSFDIESWEIPVFSEDETVPSCVIKSHFLFNHKFLQLMIKYGKINVWIEI